jgi:hypothetical protein
VKPIRLAHVCLALMCFVAAPAAAFAQAGDQSLQQEIERLRAEIDTMRKQYEERLAALEARVAAANQAPQAAQAAPAPPTPPLPPPDTSTAAQPGQMPGVAAAASKVFNPDISVIGNLIGAAGENPNAEEPSLSLSEVETAFQAIIDPYARADFFLSAGPEGLEVEEGYATFTSLPAGLLLKAGKMRAQFGKVNAMHTHILPWVDRPLVLRNLFGGEEGVADAGLSLSKLIPNRFMFVDAIGEVYRGDSDVFHSEARSELNYLGRLRAYRDFTEGTNLDLGTSYAFGPSALVPDFNTHRIGVDATFRYRPLRRAIYRQFVGRSELIWSHQELPTGVEEDASGFYVSGDYQFARRWFLGARGDRSGRAMESELHDSGASVHLTYRPSEFSLIRGQYRRTQYAEGTDANEFLFQMNFSIGAHGAHQF